MSQTNFIYFLEADDKIVGSPIMIITFLLVQFTFSWQLDQGHPEQKGFDKIVIFNKLLFLKCVLLQAVHKLIYTIREGGGLHLCYTPAEIMETTFSSLKEHQFQVVSHYLYIYMLTLETRYTESIFLGMF